MIAIQICGRRRPNPQTTKPLQGEQSPNSYHRICLNFGTQNRGDSDACAFAGAGQRRLWSDQLRRALLRNAEAGASEFSRARQCWDGFARKMHGKTSNANDERTRFRKERHARKARAEVRRCVSVQTRLHLSLLPSLTPSAPPCLPTSLSLLPSLPSSLTLMPTHVCRISTRESISPPPTTTP